MVRFSSPMSRRGIKSLEQIQLGRPAGGTSTSTCACVYLPGHNLNYTDKMSMAASVEVRVPFLDNDLVDFAFSLPSSLKVRGLPGRRYSAARARGRFAARNHRATQDRLRGTHSRMARQRCWRNGRRSPVARPPDTARPVGIHAPSARFSRQSTGLHDRSYNIWALLNLELWMQSVIDDQGRAAA